MEQIAMVRFCAGGMWRRRCTCRMEGRIPNWTQETRPGKTCLGFDAEREGRVGYGISAANRIHELRITVRDLGRLDHGGFGTDQ